MSASALSQQITTWTGNEGHIYNTTRSSLRKSIESSDSVMQTIRDEAIPLTGPEFEQLLRTIGSTRRASA
ncbi:hypothetical protein ACFJGV_11395 [Cnuibacter sp. UC19_7]|uniref:hypothetical protein n=1 Tax=Cnuibacter sp. UC19_7 TaxID=3350166 RepID=UPI0036710B37